MSLSLRQFIIRAVAQGCTEKTIQGEIQGWIGPRKGRYLIKKNIPVVLPNIRDSNILPIATLSRLVRILELEDFDDVLDGQTD